MRPALIVLLLVAPALSGCALFEDLVDQATRPQLDVTRTDLREDAWNTDARFQVVVQEDAAHHVEIEATDADGRRLTESGASDRHQPVLLHLEDGTWTIRYWIDGHRWETLKDIRIDATAPRAEGLERVGDAQDGRYTIGADATIDPGTRVHVLDMQTMRLLASDLPYTATGLDQDRVYTFLVALGDAAGNWNNVTVQVRAGAAKELPASGAYTFGIVARYDNDLLLWDVDRLEEYATPAEARSAVAGAHLGEGHGITPDEASVRQVVDRVVDPSMTTGEAAFALYRWLYDNLDYDDSRLGTNDLLEPHETMQRGGGVCRDLAALYVSLLRAADVPARVVSGYLAGGVNGFHAWVEFYGGEGHGPSPWVPVDVSPINGPYDGGRALTAFGILRPDYLTLRDIPPEGEVDGWSTALSVNYTYYGDEPRITFEKELLPGTQDEKGVLCVDEESLRRRVADSKDQCRSPDHTAFYDDFVVASQRTIDYGIQVHEAPRNAEIQATVSYPFVDHVLPNGVEFTVYGEDELVENWRMDSTTGTYTARIRP